MGSLRPLHFRFRANMQECAVAKAKVRRCDSSIALSPLQLHTLACSPIGESAKVEVAPSKQHTA